MSHGPLAGIRVLEFSQIVAGPFAGIALSDLGADVVKVEPLEGENRRNSGAVVPNEGKYFQSLNRGKRSLTVDMRSAAGQRLIRRIIPLFDVVLLNYRTGVAEHLGIDYATLSRGRPDLVYANITGFGDRGPYAARAGSDIVAQAYSGMMNAEGKTDEFGAPAQITSTTLIDRSSGLAAAMAICAALYHRAQTGEGQELHVSLLHTALELMSEKVMREPVHDANVRDPFVAEVALKRDGGARYDELVAVRKAQAPRFASHRLYYGGYHTKAGGIVLGALTAQNRAALRKLLGMADQTDDPGFNAADPESRARVEAWRTEVQQRLLERTAAEWAEACLAAGVPASVVNLPEEMADDVQVEAAGIMVDLEHEMTGPQRVVGPLVRLSKTPARAVRAAPPLGRHSREVLREAGLHDDEIDRLVEDGVIGDGA